MGDYGFKRGEGSTLPITINEENAISRGRFINRIEYSKNDRGEYLVIEIMDKAGHSARAFYSPPKKGAGFIKTDEELKKEQSRFNRMMENLTKTILGSDYETGDVDSFESFCKKVISDLGRSYYRKELRVKLVYDTKNRPTLPKWPVMFEDPILISDENTKMKITKWDRVAPVEVKMDEDKKEDDIPFK